LTKYQKNANPKYSLLEIERKWTVNKDKLPDISKLKLIEITDKYFPGTRTRLRRMFDTETKDVKYKLTKKYGKITQQTEPLTTLYLSEFEYDLFNKLEGYVLIKSLYQYPYNGNVFLLELFIKPEVGFILMEVEASSEKIINELEVPDFVIYDVTNVKEYEGYSIAGRNESVCKNR